MAVLHRADKVLITKRPEGGLLAGMWAFPEATVDAGATAPVTRSVALKLAKELGYTVRAVSELPACRHRFTHLEALYIPWSLEVLENRVTEAGFAWIDPWEPAEWALPVAQRKVLSTWMALGTVKESV